MRRKPKHTPSPLKSEHWASRKELEHSGWLHNSQGIYLGGWLNQQSGELEYLRDSSMKTVLCLADHADQLTDGVTRPTLLSWPASAVVLDIGHQHYQHSAHWRNKEAGNRILSLSLSERQGLQFNPLNEIRLGSNHDVSDARQIAAMICHPRQDDSTEHQLDDVSEFLASVILYLCYLNHRFNRQTTLHEVATCLHDDQHPWHQLLQDIYQTELDEHYHFYWRSRNGEQTKHHPYIRQTIKAIMALPEAEQQSLLKRTQKPVSYFNNPFIFRKTSRSDFRIAELISQQQPATLYLGFKPQHLERYRPLARLIIHLIYYLLNDTLRSRQLRSISDHQHQLLMLMDNFQVLGRLNPLCHELEHGNHPKIKTVLLASSLDQITESYQDHTQLFLDAPIRMACPSDQPSHNRFASQLTRIITRRPDNDGLLQRLRRQIKPDTEPARDDSAGGQLHAILSPEQIKLLRQSPRTENEQIVELADLLISQEGFPPILGKQIDYRMDPLFQQRAELAPEPAATASHSAEQTGSHPAESPENNSDSDDEWEETDLQRLRQQHQQYSGPPAAAPPFVRKKADKTQAQRLQDISPDFNSRQQTDVPPPRVRRVKNK